ncbi:TIGR00266 family protein [Carboxylicivirga sp. A043]|uniref:TIGR00266 family protein n=1 Tax=Carboxylicivirga litoralis TaxID=2816963 RepID=UPI0021CB0123|nr:TIGR00266 family protein [Carboxylicivirga sp. A043]MCU4155603.1 TIGR00266 family protein [Carboxylicivirga sp. A043]
MQSHEIDYQIKGHDIQFVEIELDPQETVIAEAGAMLYMKEGIHFEAKLGDGSEPDKGLMGKLFSAAARKITGESIFITHFTHRGSGKSQVAFAAPYPGTIVPLDLNQLGGSVIVQRDAFLCAALGTKISMHINQKLGAGFFGGEGFILQKISGDGKAFIHAGGTLIEHELNGETLRIDTGCVVGFQEGINFSIEKAGNMKSMLFGGEGLFLATLSGHGKVWIQSMPIRKLIGQLSTSGNNSKKESSGNLLGALLES